MTAIICIVQFAILENGSLKMTNTTRKTRGMRKSKRAKQEMVREQLLELRIYAVMGKRNKRARTNEPAQ